MVDFSALNFPIRTPGAADAIESFKHINGQVVALAKNGKEYVFSVEQFAAAWTKAGGRVDQAMKILTVSARDAQKQLDATSAAADRAASSVATVSRETAGLSHSSMIGIGELTRGLGRVAATGNLSAFAVRELAGGTMRLGASFGMAGGIAGLAVLAGGAIVEMFAKARHELEKTQIEFNKRLGEMAKSGSLAGLAGKYGSGTELYSGDPFAAIIGKDPKETDLKFLARSQGIIGLRAEQSRLQAVVDANPSIYRQGSKDADKLRETTKLLKEMTDQYERTMKVVNIITKTAVDEATTGFSLAADKKERNSLLHPGGFTGGANTSLIERLGSANALRNLAPQITNSFTRREELETYKNILAVEYQQQGTEEKRQQILEKIKAVLKQIDDLGEVDDPMHPKGIKAAKLPTNEYEKAIVTRMKAIGAQAGEGFVSSMAATISRGFEVAFSGGGAKSIFKALAGGVLEGLGTVFIQIGEAALVGLAVMQTIKNAILAFAPEVGLAAAIGLIAIGAAMHGAGGALSRSGSGGGGGYGGGYSSSSYGGGVTTMMGLTPVAPSSGPSAAGIASRNSVVVNATIIGKDDPAAQRQLLEMIARAQRRGSTAG